MTRAPALHLDNGRAVLSGPWTLSFLVPRLPGIEIELKGAASAKAGWDLTAVTHLDSAAAILLWRTWGRTWPAGLDATPEQRHIIDRVASLPAPPPPLPSPPPSLVLATGRLVLAAAHHLRGLVTLVGQLLLDLARLARHPAEIPWKEFSANVFKSGATALPVSALVGFLIGVTISYLAALQLKNFGAELFIVNLLGISILRELGPVLVAVLVAGRSGSAMTAQIGVMKVTEEIDALATMGISRTIRIILPKVAALTLVMPLLVVWTSAVALVGGILAAQLQLDLSPAYFLDTLPRVVPAANLVIGLAKGAVFGFAIALVACYFGLQVRPNTDSLSAHTTAAVVIAITTVIVVDAVFAVLTRGVGMPKL